MSSFPQNDDASSMQDFFSTIWCGPFECELVDLNSVTSLTSRPSNTSFQQRELPFQSLRRTVSNLDHLMQEENALGRISMVQGASLISSHARQRYNQYIENDVTETRQMLHENMQRDIIFELIGFLARHSQTAPFVPIAHEYNDDNYFDSKEEEEDINDEEECEEEEIMYPEYYEEREGVMNNQSEIYVSSDLDGNHHQRMLVDQSDFDSQISMMQEQVSLELVQDYQRNLKVISEAANDVISFIIRTENEYLLAHKMDCNGNNVRICQSCPDNSER